MLLTDGEMDGQCHLISLLSGPLKVLSTAAHKSHQVSMWRGIYHISDCLFLSVFLSTFHCFIFIIKDFNVNDTVQIAQIYDIESS